MVLFFVLYTGIRGGRASQIKTRETWAYPHTIWGDNLEIMEEVTG